MHILFPGELAPKAAVAPLVGLAVKDAEKEMAASSGGPSASSQVHASNTSLITAAMQAAAEDSDSEDDEPPQMRAAEEAGAALSEVAAVGEDLALSNLSRPQLIAQAFDDAYDLIDLLMTPHDDSPAGRELQARKAGETGKACNESFTRAKMKPLFSQYMVTCMCCNCDHHL